MIKLRIIAFFLALLLTFQMLSAVQVGKLFGKGQLTEELSDDASNGDTKPDPFIDFNHPFLPPSGCPVTVSHFSETKALAYIHFSVQIPSNHSTDVVIPPPDSVC